MITRKLLSVLFLLVLLYVSNYGQMQGREVNDLSQNSWTLRLDKDAKWIDDKLYLPPVNIKSLPVNPPSKGWENLENEKGVTVHLPATVEEYFWGANGNSFGLTGNYLGVSWFNTEVNIPQYYKGKRITLQFEGVRFRAEIFINRKLAGYDLVNSTPFEIDITDYVEFGMMNKIAVRITDPNGNFDWRDSKNFMWGNYRTIPSHGFGGITGRVKLVATDKVYIEDLFVKNKPNPKEIDLQITLNSDRNVSGSLILEVKESKGKQKILYNKKLPLLQLAKGVNKHNLTLNLEKGKLWSVDEPNLYNIKVKWEGDDNSKDEYVQRFGLRWFEVRDVEGDKQFYLNGKRIVLRTAISWGFWPLNGIVPPNDEFAKKQIVDAKKIGLNMLNFHRAIGQQNVMDYADELGLLYFEEPGGYQFPYELFTPKDELQKFQNEFYVPCRREKLFRMIKRDRNHPSVIIYNMHNERGAEPCFQDSTDIRDAHLLDETRIITYNSSNGDIKMGNDPRFKMHMLPYSTEIKIYGWFDQHHAGGPGVYHNGLYNGPKDYLRFTDHKDEIIYWGEEGAIGTPPRLQLIRNDILKRGKNIGWESDTYLKWYDAYDSFLKNSGFNKYFKDVDALTTAMGDVAYYYQGRMIENIRINNITDGYAINGWESMILENHSGIVDNYRNPKGNVDLISKYTKPLVLSVKVNRKVVGTKDTSTVDFHIINEVDLKGDYILSIHAKDAGGEILSKEIPVKITGGSTYGELLSAGLKIVPRADGYIKITAQLNERNKVIANGEDEIFVVSVNANGIPVEGMVADSNGVLSRYLKSVGVNTFKEFKASVPEGKYLLVGEFNPPAERELVTNILEWVNNGNTLIIVNNTEKWAAYLAQKEVLDYRGSQILGKVWYGGNYFVKKHPLFDGMPQPAVFNWEYQCFAAYNKNRLGLRLSNGETIVGCVSDHKKEVYSALSIIPHGRGKIILSALDMISCLKEIRPVDVKSDAEGANAAMKELGLTKYNTSNVVAQRLLINMLKSAN